jgi:Tfp pilus assembly protein PilV
MSKTLSSVAVIEFDSMVKHAYQGMGLMKPAVTIRNNVVGDTYKFRRMGKGLANQKSTSDLVTPMDVAHEFKIASLSNWNAPEYTDIFDQQDVNFDEKQELASTIAGALGRRCDQLVIDAMNSSTPDAADIAHGNAALSMNKVIEAQVALRKNGVQNANLYAAVNSAGLGGLLKDEKATNADYQTIKALVTGDVNSLAGFTFIILEDRSEGGLTVAGNTVDSWFFQKDAVGLAIGIDMKTSIDYVPERTSYLCNGMLKAGSVVRDNGGLVKVEYKDNV